MKTILVLNAGSSSLKFALYPLDANTPERIAPSPVISGQYEGIGTEAPQFSAKTADGRKFKETVSLAGDQSEQHRSALSHLFDWLHSIDSNLDIAAAGHRVVHGGEKYSAPLRLTPENLKELEAFIPLAPLHQPHNLRAVQAVQGLLPEIGQVGCFDTAFHRTQSPLAQTYAIPRALTQEGVKGYGFHGLSYDYVSRQLPEILGPEKADGAVIIAHLGNGASMCALRGRKSVTTTMGFTAVDGLMMGTRCGIIDPGVLLYLMERKNMDAAAITKLLYKESGLLGVSGISQDMRDLLESDAPEAHEAVDLFCYRIARSIGSLAAAVQGLDALIFTGGIGEHAPLIRKKVVQLVGWMGLELDERANEAHSARIDAASSRVAIAVIPTNEERMIARYTAETLGL